MVTDNNSDAFFLISASYSGCKDSASYECSTNEDMINTFLWPLQLFLKSFNQQTDLLREVRSQQKQLSEAVSYSFFVWLYQIVQITMTAI